MNARPFGIHKSIMPANLPASRPDYSVDEIKARLLPHVLDLCHELLPGGRRVGDEWVCADLNGGKGRSFSVRLSGSKAGVWRDFASSEKGGDILDLVAAAFFGRNIGQAIVWAKQRVGLGGRTPASTPRQAMPPPTPRRTEDDDPAQQSGEMAARCWGKGVPMAGTIASTYLATRGLQGIASDALRFSRAAYYDDELRLPAMLAAMTDPITGEFVGLHRTFLREDGSGKANVQPNRKMLGRKGVIRLSPDEDVTDGLGIAEGVETGLSALAMGWRPVWACGDAGNMGAFPVLQGVECLTIFADLDKAGMEAAARCAERWSAAGKEVNVHISPVGDLNDVAKAKKS